MKSCAKLFAASWICFLLNLSSFHCRMTPRIIRPFQASTLPSLKVNAGNYAVFLQDESTGLLYVGGIDNVYQLNYRARTSESIPFDAEPEAKSACKTRDTCKNYIQVLQSFNGSIIVCGTNAEKPQCWRLDGKHKERIQNCGKGIATYYPNQTSISLVVEKDLYAAAPFNGRNINLQLRRVHGGREMTWSDADWMRDPKFIRMSHINRKDDPDNEKIYLFFMERKPETHPDEDPWVAGVAQVCKVDEGGPKVILNSRWTTFLKAKLRCSIPSEAMYFNRLQDVFVLHSENWKESRVYGLFTSTWNSTAVCVYSMEEIDRVFRESALKHYTGSFPDHKPGMCVQNSRETNRNILNAMKDHHEVEKWIEPVENQGLLFFVPHKHYQKIVVDRVRGTDANPQNVLFLSTDKGTVHKVLEENNTAFNMLEIHPFNTSTPIQIMSLDSTNKVLYVGSAHEVVQIPLSGCEWYGDTELDCHFSKDPYCTWKDKCMSSLSGGTEESHFSFQIESKPDETIVPHFSRYYISCPMRSQHASYYLNLCHIDDNKKIRRLECSHMKHECVHFIDKMMPENYGTYKCIAEENGFVQTLKQQKLVDNGGRAFFPSTYISMLLSALIATATYHLH
uniref:Sema domain-containing protein n=1 Tax=Latimeria chalumnae TaxID=7897 RepID=M3XIB1_LATCH|nr:PREDICTED: semaphorin-7A-like [Latimeria chalumnae]XP_014354073.1 PREDICTED: semaphorin-7A-like [Latimeria chalumnae]|eukprot:XP_006012517.1 PREDICTED: semaphorin-7A-like [Latimeria chalumnae]